jgi:hypothetical protein
MMSSTYRPAAILAVAALVTLGPAAGAWGGNLYVVIATDDAAPTIGFAMQKNSGMMFDVVKRNVPRDRALIYKVPAASFTAATALRYIREVPAGAGDAFLFYYSGHGAYDERYKQTYLMMSRDNGRAALFVSQIRGSIEAKGVRFVAIVLDCCNNLRPVRGLGPMLPGEPPEYRPPEISPAFRRLFFEPTGTVIVESSAPREYAVVLPKVQFVNPRTWLFEVHSGSLFTDIFSRTLGSNIFDDDKDRPPEWSEVCQNTQREMDDRFPGLCPNGLIPLGDGKMVPQKQQTVTAWIDDRQITTR